MRTIKRGIVFPATLAIFACWSLSLFAQTIQIGNLQIPVADLQLVDSNAIPDAGTFYLLQDALDSGGINTAPCPGDPVPQFPVYYTGFGNVYLVDNTGITDETIQQILIPLFIIPDPNAPGAPQITWPVSVSGLTLVQDVPEFGTFYLYQDQFATDPPDPPPYPFVPDFAQGAPIYALSANAEFLVDDTGVTRPESGPMPEYSSLSYGTSLGLYITGFSNYVAYLVLTNTLPGANYDILYKQKLTDPTWEYAGTIMGETNQNWTPFIVPVGSLRQLFFWAQVTPPLPGDLRLEIPPSGIVPGQLTVVIHNTSKGQPYDVLTSSNLTIPMSSWTVVQSVSGAAGNSTIVQLPVSGQGNFFVCARFGGDSQGNLIPDWWQLEHFGYVGIDPFADPDGDGWNNLQEYENGTNPNGFDTPPAPQGLSVHYNSASGAVHISWLPSPGPVTGYTVEKVYTPAVSQPSQTTDFNFAPNVNAFGDSVSNSPYWLAQFGPEVYGSYQIQAHYGGGDSAWSSKVFLEPNYASLESRFSYLPVQLVAGPQGSGYLAANALPPDTVTLRITMIDWIAETSYGDSSFDQSLDIPVSALTNGLYLLPASLTTPPVDSYGYSDYTWWVQTINTNNQPSAPTPLLWFASSALPLYFDGSIQLTQNLSFLLRINDSQNHSSELASFKFHPAWEGTLTGYGSPTNYVYVGLYSLYEGETYASASLDVFGPFRDNYFYRNFVLALSDLNSLGWLDTGIDFNFDYGFGLAGALKYQFTSPSTPGPIPAVLSVAESQWLAYPFRVDFQADYLRGLLGVYRNGMGYAMTNGAFSFWGLPFVSVELAFSDSDLQLLSPGGSTSNLFRYFYAECEQPVFETIDYYFCRPSMDPLPGLSTFSPTNTAPLLLAPFGNTLLIAGYAKQAILNGYTNYFAYLGQYFDQAYSIGTDGAATTNSAGLLSSYGEFFPTSPGPAALVTMADIDNGQRGTGVVNVIKLQLDVDHNTNMDLSFGGPDNISQARPYRWWVNDDNDGTGVGADTETNSVNPADYMYGKIRSRRNLEDFSRLWVCGLPKLPTSSGYTIALSMSPSSGNPAINLYAQYDPSGSAAYLSDTNAAAAQFTQYYLNNQLVFDFSQKLKTINSSQSYTLPVNTDGTPQYTHFLFEGAGVGAGQLTLTISQTTAQGSNVLAQTSTWLDLHDVRDFYERMAISNSFNGPISSWSSGIETIEYPVLSTDDDTNLIVFVHGMNVGDWPWLQESDTVFKRLYWAGYRGKFATVKWPCNFLTPPNIFDPAVFNMSERNAYKSGTAMSTYLSQLRNRFPGYRLNVLAHSQGNSVVSEAINQGAPFDTYILTQGALPASCYDVNAMTNTTLLNREYLPYRTPDWQPMGYHGVYTNSNFTGKMVSFYNILDGVLSLWTADQFLVKPSQFYSYDGTNCWYLIDGDLGLYRQVTDTQESRSMIARSRTWSIGAQFPTSGGPTEGVIRSTVDLHVDYGFSDAFTEHSAQWTRPIQTSLPYYHEILNTIQP